MVGTDERTLKESPAWNHMKSLLSTIVTQRPENALQSFESFSNFAAEGRRLPAPATSIYSDNRKKQKAVVPADAISDVEWARRFSQQLAPPAPQKKGEDDEEPVAQEDKGELPDVVSEQTVFNQFGEGLTEADAFRVTVALKRLLDKEPLAKVRFWGKIFGSARDYYICEAKIDENRVPEREVADTEAPEQVGKPSETIYEALGTYRAKEAPKVTAEEGKGVNEFKYYVATSENLSEWVQLPDVLPSHITGARLVNKVFTGYLEAKVESHPPFPGVERHYLRAQIARISHSCTVCPRQMFTTDAAEEEEEDEDGNRKPKRYEVKPYDDIPALNPQEAPDMEDAEAVAAVKMWVFGYKDEELTEAKNWVHVVPQLLQEGRVTKFKPEEDATEEDDAAVQPAVEWIHPFLADLAHDAPLAFESHSQKEILPWAFRKAYHNPSNETRAYAARSLLWPGAVAYAVVETGKPGASFQNIYIGRGLKSQQSAVFTPLPPPLTSVEYPTSQIRLQKDGTYDDELEFEPAPPAPKIPGQGDDEEAQEDE
jgi:hypothetical protein